MTKQWDSLWINGLLVTGEQDNALIEHGVIAVKAGRIAWIGTVDALRGSPEAMADRIHDIRGRCLTPGFIDCHTHLVYAGNRAQEFERRLKGVSYETIAREGGGIQSTVALTRAASEEELFHQSLPRARALAGSGVTTLEIKSGYGLTLEAELKMLRVARQIGERLGLTIRTTFLGAHTIPAEYRGKAEAYVDLVCNEMLPVIAKEELADSVDVFCESIAFSLAQTERVFSTANKLGLAVKCHAEQLTDSGSAALAARYHALSADHLEHASEASIKSMADAGTVAVLLPGAYYFLRETHLPPVDLLRQYRVPIAIASDCNPGTSPITSMLTIMNMACTLFRLTPMEALQGVTLHAAQALGMAETHGSLRVGKVADFAVWDVADPVELVYYMGMNPLLYVVKRGV